MNRKDFLINAGIGAICVPLACYLVSCKKEIPEPTNVDFTLDLNDAANSALNSNGGSVRKNGIIVARLSTGNFVALSELCTHNQCKVGFDSNDEFPCPCHGSNFDSAGTVLSGPANKSLTSYNTSLNGSLLRVFF